jgi:hypothetical protein
MTDQIAKQVSAQVAPLVTRQVVGELRRHPEMFSASR